MNRRSGNWGKTLKMAAVAAALCGSSHAFADTVSRTLCIYDPIGANGFIYQSFQDLSLIHI